MRGAKLTWFESKNETVIVLPNLQFSIFWVGRFGFL